MRIIPQEVTEMSETDYLLEDMIDRIAPEYRYCLAKAKELFGDILTDETAIQSASATVWINATKEKSAVAPYINQLKSRIAKVNSEAIPSAIQVWEWHFRDFIQEFGGRITGLIHHYVSQNTPNDVIERNVKERYYHLKSQSITDADELKELELKLFGEN